MAMATHALSFSRTGISRFIRAFSPALPQLSALTIPTAIHFNIPSLLPGIWESILRAVPKKKQSHARRRMRQLAGKALEDNKALNTCPACGGIKRTNFLCKHCVKAIEDMWKKEGATATP